MNIENFNSVLQNLNVERYVTGCNPNPVPCTFDPTKNRFNFILPIMRVLGISKEINYQNTVFIACMSVLAACSAQGKLMVTLL